MEWIEALAGTIVGLDTAPLIYLIEENPNFLPFVRPFFEAVDRGEFRVVTSTLTLTESTDSQGALIVRDPPAVLMTLYRR